jgi:hypothetical protein
LQRGDEASDFPRRIGGAHHAAHNRNARCARRHQLGDAGSVDAADGEDWNPRGAGDLS